MEKSETNKPAPDMAENIWFAIHAYCKALRNNEEAGQTDHEATMMRSYIALATAKENLGSAISTALAQRDARIAELEAGLRLLTEAADLAYHQADFRNGVTDSTGSIDEGEVRIAGPLGDAIRNARSILANPEVKS